jgi:hypothetical protein
MALKSSGRTAARMIVAADVAVLLNEKHSTDRKAAAMDRRSRRVLDVMVVFTSMASCRSTMYVVLHYLYSGSRQVKVASVCFNKK